jgi:hypothetical protein
MIDPKTMPHFFSNLGKVSLPHQDDYDADIPISSGDHPWTHAK